MASTATVGASSDRSFFHPRTTDMLLPACQTNDACANFRIPGFDYSDPNLPGNMTCYKGGNTIRENFQMCDVTSACGSSALLISITSVRDG